MDALMAVDNMIYYILNTFFHRLCTEFNKCSRHYIAEILLKLALSTNQSINQ